MDTDESCSSQAVVNYLNLTQDSHKYTLSRPVKRHNHLTWIFVEMKIFAILDVVSYFYCFVYFCLFLMTALVFNVISSVAD